MKNLANKLQNFIDESGSSQASRVLTQSEQRLFRSLKTQGERATKGRLISRCMFEAKNKSGGMAFVMLMEGRHSMSVGKQVASRFEQMEGISLSEVVRTKKGAFVIMRLQGDLE